jgi:ribosomal subunit interface protein
MNTIIKGIHMDVSPSVEAYVRKKIQGLEKFIDEGSKLEVDLSKVGHQHKSDEAFKAEYKIFSRGICHKSEATSEDIYSAIDLARDEVFMVLSSRKDKRMTLWRRGGQKIKNVMRGMNFMRKGDDLDA